MAAWGGAAHVQVVAGDDPDPVAAAAAAAAARRAEEEEIWVGGNPNHLEKANELTPLEEDECLRNFLRNSKRIIKEELITYQVIPGHVRNHHGLSVRDLVFELYASLESSSRARRQLLKLMLDGQHHRDRANELHAILKEEEHVLRANPDEIRRLKKNVIVKVLPYMFQEPCLLPKPEKAKKVKKSKK